MSNMSSGLSDVEINGLKPFTSVNPSAKYDELSA